MEAAIANGLVNTLHVPLSVLTALNLAGGIWPKQARVKDGDTFNTIIIGSGVGSVVANRLTEDRNRKVLLIEAGDNPSAEAMLPGLFFGLQNSYQDWDYLSEPEFASQSQADDVFKTAAGKSLGGTSAINHFILGRGSPIDFNSWAEYLKDSSWRYSNILRYYIKSENVLDKEILNSSYRRFHGTEGPMKLTREPHKSVGKFLKSFEEIGHPTVLDITGNDTIGYTQPMYIIANGIRQHTAQAFLRYIRKRKNLFVLRKTTGTKILFDDNKNAVGVRVISENNNVMDLKASDEVILSAGVYNSPKLLMLSGIGEAEHLKKFNISVISDLPVGQNMQDHVGVPVGFKLEPSLEISQLPQLTRLPFPIFAGQSTIDKSKEYPEYQTSNLVLTHDTPYQIIGCRVLFGLKNGICQKFEDDTRFHNHMFTLVGHIQPLSRGEVRLRSADPKDPPIIRPNLYSNRIDLENMVNYVKDFVRVENTTHFRNVKAQQVKFKFGNVKFGTRDYYTRYVEKLSTILYHTAGTCAMGSVVDSKGKVYGVQRLRVVDASIMPNITRSYPLASAIMIAEKISDDIKNGY